MARETVQQGSPPAGAEGEIKAQPSERERVLLGYRREGQRNPFLVVGESPHFIVAFKTDQVQKVQASYADPVVMADFLEAGLVDISSHFGLAVPDETQVVDVMGRGIFTASDTARHLGGRKDWDVFHRWNDVRFNKVFVRDEDGSGLYPEFYAEAARIAIGRASVLPELVRKRDYDTSVYFRDGGIERYAECLAVGMNPHDLMRATMAQSVYSFFVSSGKWKEKSEEYTKAYAKFPTYLGFSIDDAFKIEKGGNSVVEHSRRSDDIRGASFMKFFIDTYGMDAFKSFAKKSKSGNFFSVLRGAASVETVGQLQAAWRMTVLNGFMDNPILDEREAKLPHEKREEMIENRRNAWRLYLLFS